MPIHARTSPDLLAGHRCAGSERGRTAGPRPRSAPVLARGRTRPALYALGSSLALACANARAQDEATTLAALVGRAEIVAVARVVRVDLPEPGTLRVALQVEQLLHGAAGSTVTLTEPAERGCGRSLHAALPGQRFLACLRGQGDAAALCAGGARALPLATAAVVAHARALLAAAAGPGRVAVLLEGLQGSDPRVRGDAALALPFEPSLASADAAQRATLTAALAAALDAGDRTYPHLVTASVHLRHVPAIDALLPRYLEGRGGAASRLLAQSMLAIDQDATVTRLAARVESLATPQTRAQALDLLLAADVPAARPALLHIARSSSERGSRARACAGLLRLGVDAKDLGAEVEPDVLELAQRLARPTPPRFRAIRPE